MVSPPSENGSSYLAGNSGLNRPRMIQSNSLAIFRNSMLSEDLPSYT
jgi:hypothetical protein